MFKFVLQFIAFFLFWKSNAKQKGTYLTPSSFLLLIYVVGAFCGILVLDIVGFTEPQMPRYWIPTFLFVISVMCFLYPFKRYDETVAESLILPPMGVLNAFSTVLIALSFYAIIYFSSSVNMIFSMSDLSAARNARYIGEEYVEGGLLNTIASVSASLYVFALLMFFVYSAIGGNNKRRILLLLSSMSEPLHILSYVGRDGVVFWIFSFVFLYLLFRPYLEESMRKKVRKFFIIGLCALLFPFVLITLSRFSTGETGAVGSIVSYMGQSFVLGPLFYGIEDKPIVYGRSFPLFWEITGLRPPISMGLLEIGEWKSWQFSTFVVGFYKNFGAMGMAFVCLIMFAIFYGVFGKSKSRIKFHQLFIYIIYFQVIAQGVFYFRQYTRGGNLFIIICFLLFFIFKYIEDTSTPVILEKKRDAIITI